nr:unnamed protein product [Callosobruchus analis]
MEIRPLCEVQPKKLSVVKMNSEEADLLLLAAAQACYVVISNSCKKKKKEDGGRNPSIKADLDFELLLNKIGPQIQKKDTHLRLSIPAKEILAVTLRYLASGDSYQSLVSSSKFLPK